MERTACEVKDRDVAGGTGAKVDGDMGRLGGGIGEELPEGGLGFYDRDIGDRSEREGIVATLRSRNRLGDGLAGERGGADVIFDKSVDACSGSGESRGIAAVGVKGKRLLLPSTVVEAEDDFGILDAVDIVYFGTERGVFSSKTGTDSPMVWLVEDAYGMGGGYLLGDAVDGTAKSVERTDVDTVEGISRIGLLD